MRVIHAALDAGVNVVDTTDVCSDGESGRIVGKTRREASWGQPVRSP